IPPFSFSLSRKEVVRAKRRHAPQMKVVVGLLAAAWAVHAKVCVFNEDCASDTLWCNLCKEGKGFCTTRVGVGKACGGLACDKSSACELHLVCVVDGTKGADTVGVCRSPDTAFNAAADVVLGISPAVVASRNFGPANRFAPFGCWKHDQCAEDEWCRERKNLDGWCSTVKVCTKRVPEGERCGGWTLPCYRNLCKAGLTCEYSEPTGDVPGHCRRRRSPGNLAVRAQSSAAGVPAQLLSSNLKHCTSNEDCEAGQWCREVQKADGQSCTEAKKCVNRVGQGERCGGYTLPCFRNLCLSPLVCEFSEPTGDIPGTCRLQLTSVDSVLASTARNNELRGGIDSFQPNHGCWGNDDCDADEWCRVKQHGDGTCSAVRVCTSRVGLGEYCGGFTLPCYHNVCLPSLQCVYPPHCIDCTGICRPRYPGYNPAVTSEAAAGQVAAQDFAVEMGCFTNSDCKEGHWCRPRQNADGSCSNVRVCVPRVPEGGGCGGFVLACYRNLCLEDLVCEYSEKTGDLPGRCRRRRLRIAAKPELPVRAVTLRSLFPLIKVSWGCGNDTECAADEWCRERTFLDGSCSAWKVCVKKVDVGERCGGYTLPCYRGRCLDGLVCQYSEPTHDIPGHCRNRVGGDVVVGGTIEAAGPGQAAAASGAACTKNSDCGSAEFCKNQLAASGACSSSAVCTPRAGAGASCGSGTPCQHDLCQPDLECVQTEPNLPGACRRTYPRADAGQHGALAGGPAVFTVREGCVDNDSCGADEFCRPRRRVDGGCSTAMACTPRATVGESCGGYTLPCYHELCEEGLVCVFGLTYDRPGRCTAPGGSVFVGADKITTAAAGMANFQQLCRADADCGRQHYCSALCTPTGVCLPRAAEGKRCGRSSSTSCDAKPCRYGLWCKRPPTALIGTCERPFGGPTDLQARPGVRPAAVDWFVLSGQQQCSSSLDCAAEDFCQATAAADGTCTSLFVCTKRATVGERCGGFTPPCHHDLCHPDLVCVYPEESKDAPGTCRVPSGSLWSVGDKIAASRDAAAAAVFGVFDTFTIRQGCLGNEDCDVDEYCTPRQSLDGSCSPVHVCVPRVAAGECCAVGACGRPLCKPGLACVYNDTTAASTAVCRPPASEKPVPTDTISAPDLVTGAVAYRGCTTDRDCPTTHWCRTRKLGDACSVYKVCTLRVEQGKTCGGYGASCTVEACAEGLACEPKAGSTGSTCVRPQVPAVDELTLSRAGTKGRSANACAADGDCSPTHFCRPRRNADGSCSTASACVPRAAEGQQCGGLTLPCFGSTCQSGLSCVSTDSTKADLPGTCRSGTQTPKTATKLSFSVKYIVPECVTDSECKDDEWCRVGQSPSGLCAESGRVCAKRVGEGESCGGFVLPCYYDICLEGLTCKYPAGGPPDASGVCSTPELDIAARASASSAAAMASLVLKLAPGLGCVSNSDCDSDEWCRSRRNRDGTCSDLRVCTPRVPTGSICGGFTLPCYHDLCLPGLVCDYPTGLLDETGICKKRPFGFTDKISAARPALVFKPVLVDWAQCESNDDCEADEWCRSQQNIAGSCSRKRVCTPRVPLGSVCGGLTLPCYHNLCLPYLTCEYPIGRQFSSGVCRFADIHDLPPVRVRLSNSCSGDDACPDDEWCRMRSNPDGTCSLSTSCTKRVPVGSSCGGLRLPCHQVRCMRGLVCEGAYPGTCRVQGQITLSSQQAQQFAGARTFVAPRSREACDHDSECSSDEWCRKTYPPSDSRLILTAAFGGSDDLG
ncbi:hypothetical protein DIPPA_09538, partial [Diplonema papillatum]